MDVASDEAFANAFLNLAFYAITATIYLILFRDFWKDQFNKFKNSFGPNIGKIFIGFLMMLGVSFIVTTIYNLLGVGDQSANQEALNELMNGPIFNKISLVLFSVIGAPIVEEMVFRFAGFRLFRPLRHKVPTWVVIIVTSLLFGYIHVMSDDLVQIIYYAGLGAALGIMYANTKNLLVPIGVHMLWNGFVTITMLFL